MELGGASGEEPISTLEQVGSLKQESMDPLVTIGAPRVKSGHRVLIMSCMCKFYGPKMFHQ